jgi:hypothetical protein
MIDSKINKRNISLVVSAFLTSLFLIILGIAAFFVYTQATKGVSTQEGGDELKNEPQTTDVSSLRTQLPYVNKSQDDRGEIPVFIDTHNDDTQKNTIPTEDTLLEGMNVTKVDGNIVIGLSEEITMQSPVTISTPNIESVTSDSIPTSVRGTVVAIDPEKNMIILTNQNSQQSNPTILVWSETASIILSERQISPQDIQTGDVLEVTGVLSSDNQELFATKITIVGIRQEDII